MKNCIRYVLQEQKVRDGLIYMTGPAPVDINADTVYQAFLEEKRIWNKDSGRMYNHNVISFHEAERIEPEEALSFGIEFAEKWFPVHQTLIAVHQDKEHLHIHLITNTVSFENGMKLHNSKKDLEEMKALTNRMCQERGLSIAEKGKDFYGNKLSEGEITSWSKDAYHLLVNDTKKSYLADCGLVVLEAKENCNCKEQFIERMNEHGWKTIWEENKKHITFQNANGEKVRDSNLSKTFSLNISKEALEHEFKKQNEKQQQAATIRESYKQNRIREHPHHRR